MASPTPLEHFRNTFSAGAAEALEQRFAAAPKDTRKLKYFLGLAETSPQADPCGKCAETQESHMLDLLAKMALYAPEVWYEVVTGQTCPEGKKNDYSNIGVAFDASSRLRRAGIEFYHSELTRKWMEGQGKSLPVCYVQAQESGDVQRSVEATKALLTDQLPEIPKTPSVRVVAISDTHLLHDLLSPLPKGDLLLHCGDLSFEESRSEDAREFDKKWAECKENISTFTEWFQTSNLAAAAALRWLGSDKHQFEHRVLVAGNHDYILEQIGPVNAAKLCQAFNVDCYLSTAAAPEELRFRSNCVITVWGSGVSAKGGLGPQRAIKSGNVAYVLDMDTGDAQFREQTQHLGKGSADIMVTHGPPSEKLYGKKGNVLSCISELVARVEPKVFLCGHEHNPDNWKLEQKVVKMADGVLGVHCAVTGRWNQFCGLPFVVDVPARPAADCQSFCSMSCGYSSP